MAATVKVSVRVTDLWKDDCGWSENASWCRQFTVELPLNCTDLKASRIILAAVAEKTGMQYFKRDKWCPSDYGPWRCDAVGVYADIQN